MEPEPELGDTLEEVGAATRELGTEVCGCTEGDAGPLLLVLADLLERAGDAVRRGDVDALAHALRVERGDDDDGAETV